MSIFDTKPRVSGRVYTCKIGDLIAADENPDAAEKRVNEEFYRPRSEVSTRALGDWLNVNEGTARKHRERSCACYRR